METNVEYTPKQKALLDLQATDDKMRALKKAYREHEGHKKISKLTEAISLIQKQIDETEGRLHEVREKLTAGEDEAIKAREKREEEQILLAHSSDARTAQALSKDVDALGRKIEKWEFESLSIEEERDAFQSEIDGLTQKRTLLEGALENTKNGLASLRTQIEERLTQLRQRRADDDAQLAPKLVEQYRAIATDKGTAVGVFENDVCSVCRVKLASTQIAQVHEHDGDVAACPSCRRLLVVPA